MSRPTDKVVSYADLIDDHHEALLRDTPLVSGANALQNLALLDEYEAYCNCPFGAKGEWLT